MSAAGIALVTGATRGLGRETARQLAHLGHHALVGCRDLRAGTEVAGELCEAGLAASAVWLDVCAISSVEAAAHEINRRYGVLDVLVNNAGVTHDVLALDTTGTDMREIFEVNVLGVVTTIHAMLPLLRRSAAPRIVNMSSTTASLTLTAEAADLPGDADRRLAYASSKAALNMLTVQYAQAFGRNDAYAHIKINSVTPGYTATDMNNFRGDRPVHEGARAAVQLAMLNKDGPTGRFFSDDGPVPW